VCNPCYIGDIFSNGMATLIQQKCYTRWENERN